MALPIGGFMPIPLAMMIPFMATQSMVMGDAFGQAFQYGKRKISAMTNDEFNSTTMEQLASQMFKSYQNIIPDLKQSIEQSRSLQALIVSELIKLPTSIFQEVTGTGTSPETIRKSNPTQTQVDTSFKQSDPWEGWNQFWKSASLLNKAHATSITQDSSGNITTDTSSTFNPPEFGDQSPPTIFDKEVNSALNELKYNQRIKDAEALARGQILLDKNRTVHTASGLRRQSIADSGQSPLATRARNTFRTNIDKQVVEVKRISDLITSGNQATGSRKSLALRALPGRQKFLAAAVAKLSKLRIKYQQVYGEHY